MFHYCPRVYTMRLIIAASVLLLTQEKRVAEHSGWTGFPSSLPSTAHIVAAGINLSQFAGLLIRPARG